MRDVFEAALWRFSMTCVLALAAGVGVIILLGFLR